MTNTWSHTIAQKNDGKNINCKKFPKYASLLSLWSISARERSSVDPHSELIESYLATCTCFISDRYLPTRTNVQEHIVSLISPVCKHLPWQPLGHQPPETWAPIQSTEPWWSSCCSSFFPISQRLSPYLAKSKQSRRNPESCLELQSLMWRRVLTSDWEERGRRMWTKEKERVDRSRRVLGILCQPTTGQYQRCPPAQDLPQVWEWTVARC